MCKYRYVNCFFFLTWSLNVKCANVSNKYTVLLVKAKSEAAMQTRSVYLAGIKSRDWCHIHQTFENTRFYPSCPWPSHGNSGNRVTQMSCWPPCSAVCLFYWSHKHIGCNLTILQTNTHIRHLIYSYEDISITYNLMSKKLANIPKRTHKHIIHIDFLIYSALTFCITPTL